MVESTFLNPGAVIAAAQVGEGMRVADFGTGSGFFARAAARAVGEGGVVWAVDAHRDMLPRLANLALGEGLHNVHVVWGTVEKEGGSNLPPEHFDIVIIANLLFAAEHKKALAQEAARVLRPGGQVLVVDWKDSFGGLGPHLGHVVTVGAGRDLFEGAGFAYVRDIPAGEYHWGFLARKKAPKAAH